MSRVFFRFSFTLIIFIFQSTIANGFEVCENIDSQKEINELEKKLESINWKLQGKELLNFIDHFITENSNLTDNDIFHLRLRVGKHLYESRSEIFYSYSKDFILNNDHKVCSHFEGVLNMYIIVVLKYENGYDLSTIISLLNNRYSGLSEEIAQKYLANVYYKQGNYEMAIAHWQLSIAGLSENTIRNSQKISSLYNNIGVAYNKMGRLKEAKLALETAKEKWNSIQHDDQFSKDYQTYFSMVIDDNILQLLKPSKKLNRIRYKKFKELYNYGLSHKLPVFDFSLYQTLTDLAFKCEKYDEGFLYYDKLDSLITNRSRKDLNYMFSYYTMKVKYHSIKGEMDDVFKSLAKLDSIKLAKFEWYKKILPEVDGLDSRYSNSLLIKSKQALSKEKQTRYLLFSAIGILIFLFFYILRVNRKERKSRDQINIQKNIIQFSLEKSKILIREIHHRVKNNLQFVNSIVYLEYIKNENKFDVNSFERKIISLAQVHDMLYTSDNISQVDIREYTHKLVEEIKLVSSNQFNYSLMVSEMSFTSDTTISFGLIINELITNTLKYCNPPDGKGKEIEMSIYNEEHTFILEYKDNGIELEPESNVSQLTEFSLISLLVDRLKGSLEMVNMKGYHVKILFKDITS